MGVSVHVCVYIMEVERSYCRCLALDQYSVRRVRGSSYRIHNFDMDLLRLEPSTGFARTIDAAHAFS